MHSLLRKVVVGSIAVQVVRGAVVRGAAPVITPVSSVADVLGKRQDPDAISLGLVLFTGVPESLREIAATNLPALSSILWPEFLDDRKPEWFLELPLEIQNYLIRKFGPQSAWPTEPPMSPEFGGSSGFSATTATPSTTDGSAGPSQTTRPAETGEGASQTGSVATQSPTTGNSTSFTTSSLQSSTSDASTSPSPTLSSSTHLTKPSRTPSSTPTSEDAAPPSGSLSRDQKIGLGVGIPFGLLAAAALAFGCCALCRRRKRRHVEGSIPPASPGFIPRFAFQDRYNENVEHRTPLNRDMNRSTHDVGAAWDDEGVDPMETRPYQNSYAWNDAGAYNVTNAPPPAPAVAATSTYNNALDNEVNASNYSNVPVMMMQDPKPIMAPALFHTHSSNRARGKRTSYTNLHSVTEVSEPDELESPVLGRHTSPNRSPGRSLVLTPPVPAGAQIKRKPVPSSPPLPPVPAIPSPLATSPAAKAASQKLIRQTMPEHSGSSSSGLALTTSTGQSSTSSLAVNAEATSPISPSSNRSLSNPFHYDTYIEDYGPEYQYGYVDVEDGLYGGNTSLSQYPEPRRKNSKTDWPLRNMVGSHHRRKSSPLWERIYED